MAWEQKTVLLCAPSPGAAATEFCSENTLLSTQVIYVPTHNPDLPTHDDVQVGVFAFAIVLIAYVTGSGLGAVLRLFKNER